ncbi:hypothetical protein DAERI_010055 [Deinococcus aerius]|uniref:Uncharacterized protein n=1 Tax=Deinococcus aerius TaxID=200253 RepID=A0A2I9CQY5_9DEIO|nr:hypothetical protein [Deinococcus aerius]GBF03883.1 hypothetical protein DAERI_010055 [Deinococcus aerius]
MTAALQRLDDILGVQHGGLLRRLQTELEVLDWAWRRGCLLMERDALPADERYAVIDGWRALLNAFDDRGVPPALPDTPGPAVNLRIVPSDEASAYEARLRGQLAGLPWEARPVCAIEALLDAQAFAASLTCKDAVKLLLLACDALGFRRVDPGEFGIALTYFQRLVARGWVVAKAWTAVSARREVMLIAGNTRSEGCVVMEPCAPGESRHSIGVTDEGRVRFRAHLTFIKADLLEDTLRALAAVGVTDRVSRPGFVLHDAATAPRLEGVG